MERKQLDYSGLSIRRHVQTVQHTLGLSHITQALCLPPPSSICKRSGGDAPRPGALAIAHTSHHSTATDSESERSSDDSEGPPSALRQHKTHQIAFWQSMHDVSYAKKWLKCGVNWSFRNSQHAPPWVAGIVDLHRTWAKKTISLEGIKDPSSLNHRAVKSAQESAKKMQRILHERLCSCLGPSAVASINAIQEQVRVRCPYAGIAHTILQCTENDAEPVTTGPRSLPSDHITASIKQLLGSSHISSPCT